MQKDKETLHAKGGSDAKHSEHDVEAIEDTDKDNSPRTRGARVGGLDAADWQMLTPIDDLSGDDTKRVHYYWKERLEQVRFMHMQ